MEATRVPAERAKQLATDIEKAQREKAEAIRSADVCRQKRKEYEQKETILGETRVELENLKRQLRSAQKDKKRLDAENKACGKQAAELRRELAAQEGKKVAASDVQLRLAEAEKKVETGRKQLGEKDAQLATLEAQVAAQKGEYEEAVKSLQADAEARCKYERVEITLRGYAGQGRQNCRKRSSHRATATRLGGSQRSNQNP